MSSQDAEEPLEFPSSEYPDRLGRPARRALAEHGYTRYDQLPQVTAAQLLPLHGVGPKAIRILTEELEARGMSFADG